MIGFMTCINAIFLAIVIGAFFLTRNGVADANILSVMYYIIVTPLVTVTLTKIAYSGEAEMTLIDALKRVEYVLKLNVLPETDKNSIPEDNSIVLKNVSYRYADATRDAVSDIDISIAPGEHVAFVGPSGSGKTTLAELLVRFFDVTSGEILLGGVNIKDIPSDKLMERVSFVFQDSKLIKTSILENVRMARPDATREEVIDALNKAQCADIIDKLPNGIDTVIGEKGTYLSGGEQQRITIARAVLKNAPVLILDEATAFADPDNETKVQAAFEELARGKTLIMIAHRLSTVTSADRIFVLDDGKLSESGTHNELISRGGLYKKMFEEYGRSIEWKVGA
jgi:ATP-binding cassette subfamily B protein